MLRRIHTRETRLQDLQYVSMGDQQDVTTAMLPLQPRDERRRPVQHSGRRFNVVLFKELVEQRELRPVIDRCFPLEQIGEAHRYVETGHKRGNVVITV